MPVRLSVISFDQKVFASSLRLISSTIKTDEDGKLQEKEVGTYYQFPLMLGYAMTIHKSQGKTLDSVIIDISNGAFAHGQLYVALSRTKRSEDIHIEKDISKKDLIFDKRVLEFVESGGKITNKELSLFD